MNLWHGAPGSNTRTHTPQPTGTTHDFAQLLTDRISIHLRALSVWVCDRRQPAEHNPVTSHFLLLLCLACGRLKRLSATGVTLIPLLIVRLQSHTTQRQNYQQLPDSRSIETPQARLRSCERMIGQKTHLGKQYSLARASRR